MAVVRVGPRRVSPATVSASKILTHALRSSRLGSPLLTACGGGREQPGRPRSITLMSTSTAVDGQLCLDGDDGILTRGG